MKKLVITIIVLALLVIAAPTASQMLPVEPSVHIVMHNTAPINFGFIRVDAVGGPEYMFVGLLVKCDSAFNVKSLTIGSVTDISATQGTRATVLRYNRQMSDSCTIEMFTFGIHGGALRRQIEAEGDCLITLHGRDFHLNFRLDKRGEQMFLDVIREPQNLR